MGKFKVGDRCRVARAGCHLYGREVTITKVEGGSLRYPYYYFKTDNGNRCNEGESCLELVPKTRNRFKVGDTVRAVSASKYSWGSVKEGDVGTITELDRPDRLFVDFAKQTGWQAEPKDLELVEGSERGSSSEFKLSLKEKTMNILTLAKLNPAERKLYKAGLIESDGMLTVDGRTLVLNELAQDPKVQKRLAELADDYKKEKKEDC